MHAVWPEQFVEEGNLNKNVSMLRHALGESHSEYRYIETVPKCGYRFIADVRTVDCACEWMVETNGHASFVTGEETNDECSAVESATSLAALPSQLAIELEQRRKRKTPLALPLYLTASVIIALAAIFYIFYPSPGGEAIDSVAVLPLINEAGEAEIDYLSDGISDSIINSLSRLPNLKVISLNAVLRYRGKEVDPQVAGRELNVRAVVMGRLTHRGDDLAISAELVDVRDKRRLWGGQYTRKLSDILIVQDEIAHEISNGLRLRLSGEEKRLLAKRYTENTEAYQLYLKGRYFWNKRVGASLQRAVGYFEQAVAADPLYAPAYAGLADCFALYSTYEVASGAEAFPKASEAARKALALDDALAEAHTSLAFVLYRYEWDWAGAEREFKRAIQLNPNYATAHQWYGEYLAIIGRFDEALAQQRVALSLAPLTFVIHIDSGWSFYLARRYEEALAQYQKAHEIEPNSPMLHYCFYEAYEQMGKYPEAVDEHLAAMQSDGFTLEEIAHLKETFITHGYERFIRASLQKRAQRFRLSSVEIARDYARRNVRDQAFARLETALSDRDADLVYLKFHPAFDNLRGDPSYADLLRRMNLTLQK